MSRVGPQTSAPSLRAQAKQSSSHKESLDCLAASAFARRRASDKKAPKKKQRAKRLILLRFKVSPHPEEQISPAHAPSIFASRRMAARPMVRDGAEEAPPHHEVSSRRSCGPNRLNQSVINVS